MDEFQLGPNYPNPFSGSTTIAYTIPERSDITIRIYDKSGHIVDEICEGIKPKGTYRIYYKANHLSSDLYFYQLITDKLSITKKMMKIE